MKKGDKKEETKDSREFVQEKEIYHMIRRSLLKLKTQSVYVKIHHLEEFCRPNDKGLLFL